MYQPELDFASFSPDDDIVNVSLFLLSSLSHGAWSKCSPKLVAMEKQLCIGQCYDALLSLHLNLHSKSRLLKDKFINIRHQGPNTRSQELLNRVTSHITSAAEKYTAARSAVDVLDTDPVAQW